MNIVLTGFMASGKTTVGKRIAELSGRALYDTDEMIESAQGMTVNEIFAKYGEAGFRQIEAEVIKRAAALDNAIISTGGGVPLNPENIDALRRNGVVVNLKPDFEVIEERVVEAAKTRPLLKNQTIADIKKRFDERIPAYENCDYAVHVGKDTTVDDCANEILRTVSRLSTAE